MSPDKVCSIMCFLFSISCFLLLFISCLFAFYLVFFYFTSPEVKVNELQKKQEIRSKKHKSIKRLQRGKKQEVKSMKQKANCRIGFNLAIHFPAIVRFSYLLRMSLAYDLAFGKNETVRNGTVNSRSLTRSCISCIDTCLACLHAFLERSSAENSIPGGREREKNSKRNGKGQWRVSFSRVSLSRFPGP